MNKYIKSKHAFSSDETLYATKESRTFLGSNFVYTLRKLVSGCHLRVDRTQLNNLCMSKYTCKYIGLNISIFSVIISKGNNF